MAVLFALGEGVGVSAEAMDRILMFAAGWLGIQGTNDIVTSWKASRLPEIARELGVGVKDANDATVDATASGAEV